MPEYLAPGVFVEEVSYRSKSIEGVSTTTTGFIGPARYGPIGEELEVLTSLVEFERTYGDGEQLLFGDTPQHNYLWHATRAFFEQGGKRLYVKRVFGEPADGTDGHADAWLRPLPAVADPDPASIRVVARFPGRAGERRVRISLSLGPNVLAGSPTSPANPDGPRAVGLTDHDIVLVRDRAALAAPPASPPASPPAETAWFALAHEVPTATGRTFTFEPLAGVGLHPAGEVPLTGFIPAADPAASDALHVVTVTITVLPSAAGDLPWIRGGLPLDPEHARNGARDSLFELLSPDNPSAVIARTAPIAIERGGDVDNGLDALALLLDAGPGIFAALLDPISTEEERSVDLLLSGGDDGARPTAGDYEGIGADPDDKAGLKAFEDIEDISIVAAPGATFGYENGYRANAQSITNLLIGHAERMRYRIAVLDSGDGQSISQVQAMKGRLDSTHAALYYPWVRVLDPITQTEIDLPPSGFVAGIYARNDVNRAVYKAPANEVVSGAIGFERLLNKAQQEVLNPLGVNCFRFFEGRGFRLWGARTISSDPEWKYVNLRRYFAYLERSIDRGTQWAVFEPNGEALWANVRRTISDFLLNEFVSGALLGARPEAAYFVKCDRSTMTQNDLDNGRLVCLIGVAALRPAEFVIFRIGQWTADRKS